MYQCYIVEDSDAESAQVFTGGGFKKIVISRAQNVRFTDDRSLHHDYVVYIADGCGHHRVQGHDFRGKAEVGDVFVHVIFRQAVEGLQPWVARHSCEFVKYPVGKQQVCSLSTTVVSSSRARP